jgi:hypothetical protein
VTSAAKVVADFLFWMMLGRIALQVLSMGRRTVFTEAFRLATYPAFWAVRRITPSSVGDGHIPFLSLPLLLALVILLAPR